MIFSFRSLLAVLPLLARCEARVQHGRSLVHERFDSFHPRTQVTDMAAIDLDQQEMETLMMGSDKDWDATTKVYQEGAHSQSYAEVTLAEPLTHDLEKGFPMWGININNDKIEGAAHDDFKAGDFLIEVRYATSDFQATYVGCQVGASTDPYTEGCFASLGSFDLGGPKIFYTNTENNNGRTLQGFSKDSEARHRDPATGQFYADFDLYQSFYGSTEYADKIITAALEGESTSFPRANLDFSNSGDQTRVEGVKKGTVFLSVFMFIIREMEHSLNICEDGCDNTDCTEEMAHYLDKAVAFYSGSLTITDAGSVGLLLYGLAEKRCDNFATCSDGKANVNRKIFANFNRMQSNLLSGNCGEARVNKEAIVDLMFVPMVQGVLRYAYHQDEYGDTAEKTEAQGAMYMAALMPRLYNCDPDDADVVFQHMMLGNPNPVDFVEVKKILEENYDCLGVTCSDVGGLSDGIDYISEDTKPCTSGSVILNIAVAMGVTVAAVALLL